MNRACFSLLVALLTAAGGGIAAAKAELDGMEVEEVREGEHALSVRIDGLVAHIETRQVVVNQGQRDTEVIYSFDLPVDAAVLAAEVLLPDGRRAPSTAVDARSAFRFVPEESAAGAPDIGLLRLLEVDEDSSVARYELRLYPVPAGRSATAVMRWVVPVRYRDGRMTLRLPDRGDAANLVREQVELWWRAPAGARGLRDLRSGSSRLAASTGAYAGPLRFTAPVGSDMVLEATPLFQPGQGLIAELAAVPLDRDRGAIALSLLSPQRAPVSAPAFERVILVVDGSRSLGATGLAAARAVADGILGAMTPGASAAAIRFDRKAQVVAGLSSDRAALRAGLTRALADESAEGGSDLGAALAETGDLLRRHPPRSQGPLNRSSGPRTLVVLVTDGMLPLELDAEKARARLGAATLTEVRIASVVLVPDGASAPEIEQGPLAELARATGGRVLAVRNGDVRARAAQIWAELGQPAPYERIDVDWRKTVVTSDSAIPARLESGEGVLLVGWYHGSRPAGITVRAELRGRAAPVKARPASTPLVRAALPLALIQRPEAELLPPAALNAGDAEERARTELIGAAHKAGVATRTSALVMVDPRDAFARDRLAFARRWGPGQYRRFPPPAERKLGEVHDRRRDRSRNKPAVVRRTGPRRTGVLDKGLVGRLLKQHVVPRARACYQRALRREPTLSGTVVVQLEMARGEVQHARVEKATVTSRILTDCLVDVAYATPVPTVALGETSESVVIARYPLRFHSRDRVIEVTPSSDRPSTGTPDPDDPLGGLGR